MKVLFVSRRVYPDSSSEGGSVSAFYIAKSVQSLGNEVHFLTFNVGGKPKKEVIDGIVFHRMPRKILKNFPRLSNLEYMYLQMARHAAKLAKEIKPDVIHALNTESIPACGFVAKSMNNIPFFLTVNGLFWCFRGHCIDYAGKYCFKCRFSKLRKCVADKMGKRGFPDSALSSLSWLYSYLHLQEYKYFARKADGIFAVSGAIKKCLVENGFKKGKISVAYNPLPPENRIRVSTAEKNRLRAKLRLGSKKCILSIGRLSSSKGVDKAISAMKYINNAVLLVIGSISSKDSDISSDYASLAALCKKEGVEKKVKFLGRIDNKELYKYYAIADASVLFGSYYEPFSRFLLESCSHGVPMVAAPVGGNPEIVNGKTGMITPSFEPEQIALTIKKVINDRKKWKLMSKSCLRQKENYSLRAVGSAIAEEYKKAIDRKEEK